VKLAVGVKEAAIEGATDAERDDEADIVSDEDDVKVAAGVPDGEPSPDGDADDDTPKDRLAVREPVRVGEVVGENDAGPATCSRRTALLSESAMYSEAPAASSARPTGAENRASLPAPSTKPAAVPLAPPPATVTTAPDVAA